MNKQDVRLAKNKILKCLTEDFQYIGKLPNAKRKRKLNNTAIFDKETGRQCYNKADLCMVMEAVILGLYLAMKDSEESNEK